MKRILFPFIAGAALCNAGAAELTWLTDMSQALSTAKAEKKLVLINFTGSDWCGFCKRLEAEVFKSAEFAAYAQKHLVLVEADFPRAKAQSPELKRANEALKKKYAEPFEGYPTIVLVDADGKALGAEVGYPPGSGPKKFIAKLEKLKGR